MFARKLNFPSRKFVVASGVAYKQTILPKNIAQAKLGKEREEKNDCLSYSLQLTLRKVRVKFIY